MKALQTIYTHWKPLHAGLLTALMLVSGCVPVSVDDIQSAMLTATPQAESGGAAADDGAVSEGVIGSAVATISDTALQLRLGPSEGTAVLGQVEAGAQYKVIGISSDGTWVRLEVLDSPRGAGWVPARAVSVLGDITDVPITDETGEATARPTPAVNGAVVITDGTRLRVRSAPNANGDIITYIYDGEAFTVLEQTEDGSWTRLDVAGVEGGGWVSSEFLILGSNFAPVVAAPVEESSAEATPAPVEEDATPEAAEEATPTPVTEEEATPTAVAEEEVAPTPTAVEEEAPAEPTPLSAEEATPAPAEEDDGSADSGELDLSKYPTPKENEAVIVTNGARLRVRSQPAADGDIVGYVLDGEVYEIQAVSDDGEWLQIELEDGTLGWIVDVFTLTADGLDNE